MTDWVENCENTKTWEEIWANKKEHFSNWEKALTEAIKVGLWID